MTSKRSEIELVINDASATQKIDAILKKLESAQQIGGGLGLGGGGGATTSTAPGGGGGGGAPGATPGGAPATHSTASRGGQRGVAAGIDRGVAQRQRQREVRGNRALGMARGAAGAVGEGAGGGMGAAAGVMGQLGGTAARAAIAGASIGAVAATAGVAAVLLGGAAVAKGSYQGKQKQWEGMQELAGMERGQELARVASSGTMDLPGLAGGPGLDIGTGSKTAKLAARYGMAPGQMTQTMSQYFSGIGVAGSADSALTGEDLFSLQAGGLDAGSMARFQGLGGPGMGAAGGVAGAQRGMMGALGNAADMGFRGQKVSDLLSRIASATSNMAEQGLSLDLDKYNAGVAGLSGRKGFEGMNAVRGAGKLANLGDGALGMIKSQFSGVADMAMLAKAFEASGGDPMGAIKYLEKSKSDPLGNAANVISVAGKQAGALALTTKGFTSTQAETLAAGGILPGTPGGVGALRGDPAGLRRSAALAEQKRQELDASGSMMQFTRMQTTIASMNMTMIKLGDLGTGIHDSLNVLLEVMGRTVR
jgi:hypothetical protein